MFAKLARVLALPALMFLLYGCDPTLIEAVDPAQQEASQPAATSYSDDTQFVVLAFDGSKSLETWEETLSFARQNDVKFTYFISGVYFLANENASIYRGPRRPAGRSDIGFGGTVDEVAQRVQFVAQADREGHEIASHANGHFSGASWSAENWRSELEQFDSLLRNAHSNNGISDPLPSNWNRIVDGVEGFRAPLLATSSGLFSVLPQMGYRYDTSRIRAQGYQPAQADSGLWNFPLISVSTDAGNTISMDYNFYVLDSNAHPDPANSGRYEERMYRAYMRYFNNEFSGSRAPIHIGHHFSMWNGGAYWRALKRFAQEVCPRPQVACVTYRELREALQ